MRGDFLDRAETTLNQPSATAEQLQRVQDLVGSFGKDFPIASGQSQDGRYLGYIFPGSPDILDILDHIARLTGLQLKQTQHPILGGNAIGLIIDTEAKRTRAQQGMVQHLQIKFFGRPNHFAIQSQRQDTAERVFLNTSQQEWPGYQETLLTPEQKFWRMLGDSKNPSLVFVPNYNDNKGGQLYICTSGLDSDLARWYRQAFMSLSKICGGNPEADVRQGSHHIPEARGALIFSIHDKEHSRLAKLFTLPNIYVDRGLDLHNPIKNTTLDQDILAALQKPMFDGTRRVTLEGNGGLYKDEAVTCVNLSGLGLLERLYFPQLSIISQYKKRSEGEKVYITGDGVFEKLSGGGLSDIIPGATSAPVLGK